MKKKRNVGDEIIESLADTMAHSEGKITLKTTTIEMPEMPPAISKTEISNIRMKILNMSRHSGRITRSFYSLFFF
jgi:hypothetical protein